MSHDPRLRELLGNRTGMKVSEGKNLTSPVSLDELTDPLTIGGTTDTSITLTERILILTEGVQAAGTLPIDEVRRKLMDAYSGVSRSSGRHVLSLCNDIARY